MPDPGTGDGPVDWALAERVARAEAGRHHEVPGPHPTDDELAPMAARAAEMAAETGLRPPTPARVRVIDRPTWAAANVASLPGFDKITTSQIPSVDGKPHSGAAFWSNCLALLNKAPAPQPAVDFLIYACGPQNDDWHKAIMQAGNSPAFESVYSGLLQNDAELAPFRWMTELRDQLAISVPAPKNYFYPIQNEAWTRHWPEYLKDDSTLTEDELIQKVLQTTQEILQTVLESVPTLTP